MAIIERIFPMAEIKSPLKTSTPRVAIVLLNYKGAEDTLDCLASLKKLNYPNFEIIVVDNASHDNSVEKITQAYPNIVVIESTENDGFSAGNNLGIRYALNNPKNEYVWLLNNDAKTDANTLSALIQKTETSPQSMIGSLILYPDGRFQTIGNSVDRTRFRPKEYDEKSVRIKDGATIETLCGCSMLIPREVFETIGLLDETYFLYLEDTEFCLRAEKAGFLSVVALDSKVYHQKGAATGKNRNKTAYYSQRNRLMMAQKFVSAFHLELLIAYNLFWRKPLSYIKAAIKNTPEAWGYYKALSLGIDDFRKGITGPCPHEV